jgi:uncharacterized membrane protein YjjP (DUF1212 family)
MDPSPPSPKPGLCEPEQRAITRLCVESAILLLQHGAESALVESVARRLGLALGVPRVEIALMANAVTVTTLSTGHCITTVRRNEDRGINMHVVTEVQRAVIDVEQCRLDLDGYQRHLAAIKPLRYPRWLVALMIGLSCASFARLANADWPACGMVLIASTAAMAVRQVIAHHHFNPLINFFVSAFVATSLAGLGVVLGVGSTPRPLMAACVLLFVPGFPLINAVSDMVKGYINTGLSRAMMATLLSLATCGGIILAMTLWNVWGWL